MDYPVVTQPYVPYWGHVPGGLRLGKMVEIRGKVPYGADVFQINFVTGRDDGPRLQDRPLHLSIRFYERTVVRNAMDKQEWGHEERSGGFPFVTGQSFLMMILVEESCYKIAVNGQHYWEFAHRLAYTRVTMLYIDGSVKIEAIRFMDQTLPGYMPGDILGSNFGIRYPLPGHPISTCTPGIIDPGFNPNPWLPTVPRQTVGTCIPPPDQTSTLQPVLNPTIPYFYPFYGGLKPGMMIYISGRPTASAHRFSINLQCGSCPYPPPDIGFHFDVRFYSSTIVRNTRVNGNWGKEETIAPYFSFRPGVCFDMIIRVEHDKYLIALNGQHFLEYKHRILPLSKLTTLNIENDVIVSALRFA